MRKLYTVKKMTKETIEREGDTIHTWLTLGEVVYQTMSEKKVLEYVAGLTKTAQGRYHSDTDQYIIL